MVQPLGFVASDYALAIWSLPNRIGTPTSSARSRMAFSPTGSRSKVNGVDDSGQITNLTVMIRPLSGLIALAEAMSAKVGHLAK